MADAVDNQADITMKPGIVPSQLLQESKKKKKRKKNSGMSTYQRIVWKMAQNFTDQRKSSLGIRRSISSGMLVF